MPTTCHLAGMAVRNPELVEVSRYYGMSFASCVVADPESKGGSEATVRLATAVLVPTEANLLGAYDSFTALELACVEFSCEVNERAHRETRRVPAEMLAEERAHLHPVPETPFTAAFGQTRSVPFTSTISLGGDRCSVPHALGHRQVPPPGRPRTPGRQRRHDAWVSTEARGTIGSQLETLRSRAAAEGHEVVAGSLDDGYSGARLDRPGLDALRDVAEGGLIEAVCRLTPDRLARSHACQVVVLDELDRLRVRVLFSDAPPIDDDPQARLLTQVQGVIRRARAGQDRRAVPAGQAVAFPLGGGDLLEDLYGHRRVPRSAEGAARLELYEPGAEVVRRIFADHVAGGRSMAHRRSRRSRSDAAKGSIAARRSYDTRA